MKHADPNAERIIRKARQMKTMKIKLRKKWNDNPQGAIIAPAVSLAKMLIDEEYAVEVKDGLVTETATAPPAPENAMDALKRGRRKRSKR